MIFYFLKNADVFIAFSFFVSQLSSTLPSNLNSKLKSATLTKTYFQLFSIYKAEFDVITQIMEIASPYLLSEQSQKDYQHSKRTLFDLGCGDVIFPLHFFKQYFISLNL